LDALYSNAKSKDVHVLLSGQGADELFGGYNYYQDDNLNWISKKLDRIQKIGGWKNVPSDLKDLRKSNLLLETIRLKHPKSEQLNIPQDYKSRRRYDIFGGQLSTMLWYEDRIAMHHSIEVRYPFLQPDLLSLTSALTLNELHLGNESKGLLKAALKDKLPPHLVSSSPKRGLPANEKYLIQRFPNIFNEGISFFGKYTNCNMELHLQRLSLPNSLGRRESQVLFRIACSGIWMQQYPSNIRIEPFREKA